MPTDDTVSVNNDGKRVEDESEIDKENSKQGEYDPQFSQGGKAQIQHERNVAR